MKKLTKKFRALICEGAPQDGWHEEQTGETLLPDDVLALEADTLPELCVEIEKAGVVVPEVPADSKHVQPTYTQKEYADAVEARFDREAQALGYDNLAKATTYAASGNSRFAAEARRFIALRDACWVLCFDALANPPEIPPTPSEFAEAVVTQALANVGQLIYS